MFYFQSFQVFSDLSGLISGHNGVVLDHHLLQVLVAHSHEVLSRGEDWRLLELE